MTEPSSSPQEVDILVLSDIGSQGGMLDHAENLQKWFEESSDWRINIRHTTESCRSAIVLIEFSPGLPLARSLLKVIRTLKSSGHTVLAMMHEPGRGLFYRSRVKELNQTADRLLYWTSELARFDRSTNYSVIPFPPYHGLGPIPGSGRALTVGHFGYGFKSKNVDLVLDEIASLGVSGIVRVSINQETGAAQVSETRLRSRASRSSADGIDLQVGFSSWPVLVGAMSFCSHFLFAHDSSPQGSGTMTLAAQFGRPVVCLDGFSCRLAGAEGVPVIGNRPMCLWRRLRSIIWSTLKYGSPRAASPDLSWGGLVRSVVGCVYGSRLSVSRLVEFQRTWEQKSRKPDASAIEQYALIFCEAGRLRAGAASSVEAGSRPR